MMPTGKIFGAVALLMTLTLSAFGGVFDDAVLLLQGDMDADGDGLVTQGEARNALNRNDTDGKVIDLSVRGSHDGTDKGISNLFTKVVMPRRGRTVNGRVLRFKTQSTRYSDGRDAVWCAGLAVKRGFPMSEKMEMTAVIRFRWDGFVSDVDGNELSNPSATILAYGNGNDVVDNGIRCALRKYPNDGTVRLAFNNWSWNFSVIIANDGWQIEAGKWYDLAFSVQKGRIDIYLFPQGHWDYAHMMKASRTGTSLFPGDSFDEAESSFGVAMATAHGQYDNNLFYPQESWAQSSLDDYDKGFNGDIHQLAVWNRVLDAEEIEEAFMGGEAADCQIGVVNGTGAEFASAADAADVWTEADGWHRFKGALTTEGESVAWCLSNREARAHARLLRATLCSPTHDGKLTLEVNGQTLDTKVCGGASDILFDIPASAVHPGEMNQFRLVLLEGGPVAIDAIAVGGGFAIQNKGSEVDNSGHLLDEDPLNFTSYLTSKTGHSFKNRLTYLFSLPRAFAGRRMRWTVTRGQWNGAEAAGYAAFVNDQSVYSSTTQMPSEWDFTIPHGVLREGLNTLVLSNMTTSATDSAYYTITSVTGEPLPNRGLQLIVR